MTSPRMLFRTLGLFATGGLLMQVTGCATGVLPVFLSFVESTVLSLLFGGLAIP